MKQQESVRSEGLSNFPGDKISANVNLKKNLFLLNKLCSTVCDCSVSLFNIFDNDYQYTISKFGNWKAKQLPREKTLCNSTLAKGKLLEINDINADKEYDNVEFSENESYSFYVGIPVKNASGNLFGTICALDQTPKKLTETAKKSLKILARQLEEIIQFIDEQYLYKEIEKSLQEKEVMFSEIHHRIKNNLADICGMLQMERTQAGNKSVKDILSKTESRIIAAIKLHELLYESQNREQVNIKKYIEQLTKKIIEVSKNEDSEITYKLDVDEIFLEFNQTLPLGLIINELVTNAFQHAFDENKNGGIISVEVKKRKGGEIALKVSDNGKGQIKETKMNSYGHFGLKLIKLLAKQLNANTKKYGSNGSTFEMKFNPSSAKKFSSFDSKKISSDLDFRKNFISVAH